MVWVGLCTLGLAAEGWVIIGLGRRVTRRYEAEVLDGPATGAPPPRPEPGVRPHPAVPGRAV